MSVIGVTISVPTLLKHSVKYEFFFTLNRNRGPGSVVGIATGYGLDGPGIESRWGRNFPLLTRPARGLPSLLYNGYWVFPRGKKWPGREHDSSPPSSAVVMKE